MFGLSTCPCPGVNRRGAHLQAGGRAEGGTGGGRGQGQGRAGGWAGALAAGAGHCGSCSWPRRMDAADLDKVTGQVEDALEDLAGLKSMWKDPGADAAILATRAQGLAALLAVLLASIGGFPSRSRGPCSTGLHLACSCPASGRGRGMLWPLPELCAPPHCRPLCWCCHSFQASRQHRQRTPVPAQRAGQPVVDLTGQCPFPICLPACRSGRRCGRDGGHPAG